MAYDVVYQREGALGDGRYLLVSYDGDRRPSRRDQCVVLCEINPSDELRAASRHLVEDGSQYWCWIGNPRRSDEKQKKVYPSASELQETLTDMAGGAAALTADATISAVRTTSLAAAAVALVRVAEGLETILRMAQEDRR